MRMPQLLLSTFVKVAIAALAAHYILPYVMFLGSAEFIHFSIVAIVHVALEAIEFLLE